MTDDYAGEGLRAGATGTVMDIVSGACVVIDWVFYADGLPIEQVLCTTVNLSEVEAIWPHQPNDVYLGYDVDSVVHTHYEILVRRYFAGLSSPLVPYKANVELIGVGSSEDFYLVSQAINALGPTSLLMVSQLQVGQSVDINLFTYRHADDLFVVESALLGQSQQLNTAEITWLQFQAVVNILKGDTQHIIAEPSKMFRIDALGHTRIYTEEL